MKKVRLDSKYYSVGFWMSILLAFRPLQRHARKYSVYAVGKTDGLLYKADNLYERIVYYKTFNNTAYIYTEFEIV